MILLTSAAAGVNWPLLSCATSLLLLSWCATAIEVELDEL